MSNLISSLLTPDDLLETLLPQVLAIAESAADQIRTLYLPREEYTVELKPDQTFVTQVDHKIHRFLTQTLTALTPSFPVLSEEGKEISTQERSTWPYYWLVDPLDGTKEFICRTDDFTVNIALIENHEPILGVVSVPMSQGYYWAVRGQGAFHQAVGQKKRLLKIYPSSKNSVRIVASRDALKEDKPTWRWLLKQWPQHECMHRGSALKICLVASNEADIYPRFGLTSEWDTAAGQCILVEAGGALVDLAGKPLRYNKGPSVLNPYFLAIGSIQPDFLACG